MQPEPAPPCSSPTARMPAAIAADTRLRLPDSASRAVAQDGAPEPWSATLDRIASSSARSAVGRQPRSMQQEDGVGERPFGHQRRHVVVRASRIWPSLASTIAVRQGSIWLLKLCEGTGYAA